MTRTVVVTGASAGIGLAAARLLAGHGDRIILLGRNESRLAAATTLVKVCFVVICGSTLVDLPRT